MTIEVTVSDASIEVSSSGTKVDATVSGGVGPQGPAGPAGTTDYNELDNVPAEFTPEAHASSHASAGSDPVTIVASQVSDFTTAVVAAAPPTTNASLLTSGTLPDARLSSNIARTSDVTSAVAAVVNAAPAALDTLNELAAALGNDASFSTTVTNSLAAKAPLASPTFTGTVSGITKSMVGLGNVDNTSDANKPISTATQTALDGKAASSHTHSATEIVSGTIDAGRLPTSGVSAGTYSSVTVDVYGRITAGGTHAVAWGDVSGKPATFSPSVHNQSHLYNGSDAILTDSLLACDLNNYDTLGNEMSDVWAEIAGRALSSHTHGNITSAGAIGSTSGLIVVTGTSGVLTTASTIASSAVSGLATSATTDTTNASNISSGTLSDSRLSVNAQAAIGLYLWSSFA